MAKGYWIAAYRSISDPSKAAAYGEAARPVLKAAGGQFLARSNDVTAFESGLEQRIVVIEFPSRQAAVDAYQSEAYQRALKLLDGGAERDLRIVDGVD